MDNDEQNKDITPPVPPSFLRHITDALRMAFWAGFIPPVFYGVLHALSCVLDPARQSFSTSSFFDVPHMIEIAQWSIPAALVFSILMTGLMKLKYQSFFEIILLLGVLAILTMAVEFKLCPMNTGGKMYFLFDFVLPTQYCGMVVSAAIAHHYNSQNKTPVQDKHGNE